MKKVTYQLPKTLVAAVEKLAAEEAKTPADIVREAIKRDLEPRAQEKAEK